MALLASTGLRNKVLDTASVKSILAGGFIHVYSSTVADIPATADAAIDPAKHTKLLTVYGDGFSAGLNLGTASGRAIGKAAGETWSGPVLATGNAVFFRYVAAGDTGALSTTEARYQGRCGTSGAELNLSSLALTAGNTQAVNFASISLPG
ncbi:conserved hypothetical protein [Acidovorax delafieldii 2AN]|uniref:Uncharacterized protein n=1 Tax=Acidovorax delafieldii 2AN TaxID=573060 RepID=C5T1V4_ACIDE|nr:hypothetical protein [Acidovorax delafieldii]EER61549.1 conserved hypothetical protein [Acidovorax delafieldii 2AN]